MNNFRDELRGAFDREQSGLGDVGDTRQRLVRQALATRDVPASHRLQWAAALAAVLIAAIVITTFALIRGNARSHAVPAATPSPKAQASPTPLRQALNVPHGTPVILYHDPADFDQVDGVTWDGKTSGKVGAGVTNGGNAAPDGSTYLTLSDKVLAQTYWADDSTHYCTVARTKSRDVTSPGMLQFGLPNQPLRNVVQVGTFAAANLNGGGPAVAACSPSADRAVVWQSGGQGIGVVEFWVIQLSSGRTIWHGGSGIWVVASHDGKYVAIAPSLDQPTKIYGPDGSVAGTSPDEVFAFSWDDNLAVVAGSFGAPPSVVDWRIGQTIWTCPSNDLKYWQAFPEPGGSRIAIGVLDPAFPQTGGFAPVDLFVVGADGVVVFEKKDVTLLGQ
jgi:hypothetical protein